MSSVTPLQTGVLEAIEDIIAEIINITPRLIGALLVLLVGWLIGRFVYGVISRVVDRAELDRRVHSTPLGRMFGETEQGVSRTFGKLAAWFVYALAILAAANVLAIDLLSQWISEAVSYLPALVAGALIIIGGFILADFLADIIGRTETVTDMRYTEVFADGVRIFLYFVAIVIGLDTIGVDVQILYLFAQAVSYGFAAGIALAIGIAFGWGGKDYVHDNIDNWLSRTSGGRGGVATSQPGGGSDN